MEGRRSAYSFSNCFFSFSVSLLGLWVTPRQCTPAIVQITFITEVGGLEIIVGHMGSSSSTWISSHPHRFQFVFVLITSPLHIHLALMGLAHPAAYRPKPLTQGQQATQAANQLSWSYAFQSLLYISGFTWNGFASLIKLQLIQIFGTRVGDAVIKT